MWLIRPCSICTQPIASSSSTGLPTAAFAVDPKQAGKSAKAIKVFEKGKDKAAGSITLDGL